VVGLREVWIEDEGELGGRGTMSSSFHVSSR